MAPSSTKKSTASIAPFGLRMQPDLKAVLEHSAKENGRSLNAEIVHRLEWSLQISAKVDHSIDPDGEIPMTRSGMDNLAKDIEAIKTSLEIMLEHAKTLPEG